MALGVGVPRRRGGGINYLAISTITRSGSLAMVNRNMAKGVPKAMKVQPKNSMIVMVTGFSLSCLPPGHMCTCIILNY